MLTRLERVERQVAQARQEPERFVVVFDDDPDPEPAYPGERLRVVRLRIVTWPGEEAQNDHTARVDAGGDHDAPEEA